MKMNSISLVPKEVIAGFFKAQWGSPQIVISSGIFDCSMLDGFAVLDNKESIIGLITYTINERECEIISLDSLEEGKGIGTSLIKEVEHTAKNSECKLIKVITTNDNLHALKFYQKRGYVLSKLFPNAVEKARKIKPQIPIIGNGGIPIRDEILLVKQIKE